MAFILPLILAVVGAATIVWGRRLYRQGERTRRWPTVSGAIAESGVVESQRHSGDSGEAIGYRLYIRYTYAVQGRSYESTRIALGPRRVSTSHAEVTRQAARYRVGAAVTVRYDPDDPSSAVLQVGAQNVLLLYAVGAGFIVAGFFLLLGALR